MRSYRPALLVLVVACFWTSHAFAVAPEIKDEAKFFGPEAVKKANEMIRTLARRTGVDLFIETLSAPPGDQAEKVSSMTPMERNQFFSKLAKERAENAAVRGIYVLVTRTPPHLELVARKLPSRFSRQDFEKLRSTLITAFRDKKYDEGLLNAVKLVQEKLMPSGSEGIKSSASRPS